MVIDYRKINKATRKDHYPLPFIDQMLERLSKHTLLFPWWILWFFSNTYFTTWSRENHLYFPLGTYAYRRMPFGLCNAPATSQRCMTAIFSDFCEKIVEVFMDDFSVYGTSFDVCLSNLDWVL